MTWHISIDLETMASSPDAALATIGVAVYDFDHMEGAPHLFYSVVNDPDGRHDPQTLRWHMGQSVDSMGDPEKAVSLRDSLSRLDGWLRSFRAHEEGEARLYAHATFDFPVLHMAYLRAGFRRPPWHYRNVRDLRTMYDHHGSRPEVHHDGKHNAVHDAVAQLREVAMMLLGADPLPEAAMGAAYDQHHGG